MVSSANTFYVATTGNDAVSCAIAQNISTPKRTIAAGVACLSAGDTLYIRAGTHVEDQITIKLQGTAGKPTMIAGYPGDARPVIKPPAKLTGVVGAIAVNSNTNTPADSYVTLKDFDIDGINLPNNYMCIGVYMRHVTIENIYCVNAARNGFYLAWDTTYSSDYAIVRNNHIKNCGRIQPPTEIHDTKGDGVYSVSSNALVEGNLIDGCRGGGIVINYDQNKNSIFRNNIIRNLGMLSPWGPLSGGQATFGYGIAIGGAGIHGPNGPTNNQIYNNIIYNIKGSNGGARCFSFWSGSSGNLIANNTCYNVDIPYTTVSCGNNHSNTKFQNNIFSQTPKAPAVCGITGTITNNLINPNVNNTFVNAAGGDFHLKPGSPGVNAGATVSAVAKDYDNVARPQGATYDIGAYEYAGEPSEPLLPPNNLRVISN